jgi:biopolymer transport protein ExbD
MSASMSSEVKAEPNLTPLLDVVFQLITFFMLVINFSNENYDQRVRLPVAGSARPVEEGDKSASEDRLVLNIDKQGHLLINGEVLTQTKAMNEIKHQAALVKLNVKAAGIKLNATGDLPTTIILRADRDTPFSSLFSLITACQANGFRKFALKAMNAS